MDLILVLWHIHNHKLMYLVFGFLRTTLSLKSMPFDLLPASAGAFAPRSQTTVRLGSNVHSWLTTVLKRIDTSIRCIRNVSQQVRHLKRILSSKNAIWTLCSVLIPKSPEADSLRSLDSALAIHCWRMIHVEAYIVYVDLETQDELAFKLTPETIEELIEHHSEVISSNAVHKNEDWANEAAQRKLHEEFVQSINQFIYRTRTSVLQGLDEDGTGELLARHSNRVKDAITKLFVPLSPPSASAPTPAPPEQQTANFKPILPRLSDWCPPSMELDAVDTAWCSAPIPPGAADYWYQPLMTTGPPAFDAWRAVCLQNGTTIESYG